MQSRKDMFTVEDMHVARKAIERADARTLVCPACGERTRPIDAVMRRVLVKQLFPLRCHCGAVLDEAK